MGRSCRKFTIDGRSMRTGRPKLDRPYEGGEKIPGPPYHFNIIVDKEHLDKLMQGGEMAVFNEWGTSCCDCWTWFQHPIQVFKYVVFQKYEHLVDDYASDDNAYVKVFFTADEMWQIDSSLMEEIPHEPNTPWPPMSVVPASFDNAKEMPWAKDKRCWKLINGEWEALSYETRPTIAWSY